MHHEYYILNKNKFDIIGITLNLHYTTLHCNDTVVFIYSAF